MPLQSPFARRRSSESLPFEMFEHAHVGEEARRARKLEGLYHVGQESAWDGRAVLRELLDKHGGVCLHAGRTRDALMRIFGVIMWGELAAWKISAQLADLVEPLEAKMAATSQAHDEARHFYVMHDYLTALGGEIPPMNDWARRVIELPLKTDDVARKVAGMQIQVETIALTIFAKVRALRVEPVLTELLPYFERDEARHIGLGVQFLPGLIAGMSRVELARFAAFQLEMLFLVLAGEHAMLDDLEVLGIDPREFIALGVRKQLPVLNDIASQLGETAYARNWAAHAFDVAAEAFFPLGGRLPARARARRVLEVAVGRAPGLTQGFFADGVAAAGARA
jgi:hypothetical protein